MEKKINDVSVPVERKNSRKVDGIDRETIIENAVQAADNDVEDSELLPEETTSKKLFNHLFEACNILRGPINQDEYKSYVTPILFFHGNAAFCLLHAFCMLRRRVLLPAAGAG